MRTIKIKKIKPLKKDERGLTYGFSTRKSRYFLVLNRKKGSVSGRHYHAGASKSKNPEIFYLIKGRARLIVRDMKSKNKTKTYIIEENCIIEVPANMYHEFHALTDVIFLELNIKKENFEKHTYRK